MDLAKTQKIIYREFTRSKAKTVFLLAMCPVALYFIVPALLPGKPSNKKAKTNKRAVVVQADTPQLFRALNPPPRESEVRPEWEQLSGWMERDPFTRPAQWQREFRNPFHSDRVVPAGEFEEDEQEKVGPETVPVQVVHKTPEDLGFTLTATVVGRKIRLATINGQNYREHDLIPMDDEESESPNPRNLEPSDGFTLLEVGRRSVVLGRSGEEFELSIPMTRLRNGHALISHGRN